MSTAKKDETKDDSASGGFSAEERAAIKERAAELKASGRGARGIAKAEGEARDVVAKIAELDQPDRGIAERLHEIITEAAPELAPKLWYGMPAYAKSGKVVCFFQASQKFNTRYSTLGFSDPAQLDEGTMWPTAYAITELRKADEKAIAELVRRAVG